MTPGEINILIACEESQAVCIEFRKLGFNAFSCDLQECSGGHPEWHLQIDCFDAIKLTKWNLIILHPPCTYTALCGNRWYYNDHRRMDGIKFCNDVFNFAKDNCNNVILEQPKTIMQKYIGKKSQKIQPYQFGHLETKETWLWIKGLPLLQETNNVKKEMDLLPKKEKHKIWYKSPGKNRGKDRSKTYKGIAEAIAKQYGYYLLKNLNQNQ